MRESGQIYLEDVFPDEKQAATVNNMLLIAFASVSYTHLTLPTSDLV